MFLFDQYLFSGAVIFFFLVGSTRPLALFVPLSIMLFTKMLHWIIYIINTIKVSLNDEAMTGVRTYFVPLSFLFLVLD